MFLLIDSFTKIELLLQGPALQFPGDLGGGLCRDTATVYEQNRHQMPPFYRQLKSDCFTRTNVELLLQGPAQPSGSHAATFYEKNRHEMTTFIGSLKLFFLPVLQLRRGRGLRRKDVAYFTKNRHQMQTYVISS